MKQVPIDLLNARKQSLVLLSRSKVETQEELEQMLAPVEGLESISKLTWSSYDGYANIFESPVTGIWHHLVVLNLEEDQATPPPLKVVMPHYRELDPFDKSEVRAKDLSSISEELKPHITEFFSLVTAFQVRDEKRFFADFETVEGGDILAQTTSPRQLELLSSMYRSILSQNIQTHEKEAQE